MAVNILSKKELAREGDWAPSLSAALAESDEVFIPAGRYRMSTVDIPAGKTVYGDGEGSVIVPLRRRLFNITGSVTATAPLAADAADHAKNFRLAADIGLESGDLVYLMSQRNCQILADCGREWTLGRTYSKGFTCFFAEFLHVCEVAPDGMGFAAKTECVFPGYCADGSREHAPKKPHTVRGDYPYMRQAATVSRIAPARGVILRDLNISECRGGTVVMLRWAEQCRIERVRFSSSADSEPERGLIFVYIAESADCTVSGAEFCVPKRPPRRYDYKWADYWSYNTARIVSSQRCGFENCRSDFSTHAYEIGKADKHGASSGCFVRNCRAAGAVWSGVFVGGGSYDTEIRGCRVTDSAQGIVSCGRKNLIADNRVEICADPQADYYYVKKRDGGTAAIALIEGYSIDSTVCGNTVSGADTAFLIRDGYEDDNKFEYGSILLTGNRARNCGRAVMVYRIFVGTCRFGTDCSGKAVSHGSERSG